MRRAERGAKIFEVFRVKNHIFSNFRGAPLLTCLERHTPWTPNTSFVDFEKSCRYKTLHFSSLHFQWPLTRLIDFFPHSYIVFIYYWIFCGPEYSLNFILLAGREAIIKQWTEWLKEYNIRVVDKNLFWGSHMICIDTCTSKRKRFGSRSLDVDHLKCDTNRSTLNVQI